MYTFQRKEIRIYPHLSNPKHFTLHNAFLSLVIQQHRIENQISFAGLIERKEYIFDSSYRAVETFYERVEDRIELEVGGRERKVEASWVDRTRRMTGTPFSFARRGEIETANRVRVGGGWKQEEREACIEERRRGSDNRRGGRRGIKRRTGWKSGREGERKRRGGGRFNQTNAYK